MRGTFWPNRIFQSFRCKNRSTGLKVTPIRESSRFTMKIVQNVLFRECRGRFDQIEFFHVPDSKIAHGTEINANTWKQWAFYENCTKRAFQAMRRTFWPNRIFQPSRSKKSLRGLKLTPTRENNRLSMKIVENVLFKPCGRRFDQIAFLNVSERKIALPDWNSRQYVNTVGFPWKLYKTCFSGNAEDVWPNRIFQCFRSKNRSAGLKLTPIRENSRLCMKIVQNVLFRPCGGRFDQIAFFNVSEPKIALRDWNSRQYVKIIGFLWKLYKTCFSGHAEDVLTKSHFSTFQIQKSLCGTEIHANTWKQ